ncbi:transmembrane protein, putative [Medicago truncatula]|uniref:Transmembrane protein, putative n=1 Tax=Medicago truncatula TaxID=3880 RepID=A0A072U9K8_MEDTR|nr:transmembrane protein, putative [Medicago truncatula]
MLVGRLFCFEIGSWCLSAIYFDWLWCFSGKRRVRWPYDLVLKTGGPIAFDSRSGVSYVVQVWFWALLVFFWWTRDCAVVEAN